MFEKNARKKPMPRGSLWNLFKEQKGKQKCRQKKKKSLPPKEQKSVQRQPFLPPEMTEQCLNS